jgi:hypothetical protein
MCENSGFTNLVPQGRLKKVCVAGHFQPSLRDFVVLSNPTQD